MGKNQSASNLTNIIKQDASGNITFVSGSTTLMSVSSSGAVTTTGNVAGTASYASNAELFDGLDSTVFTLTSSFIAQTASFTAFTASQNILNGTYATTGSNTFAGIQTINSNLTVTGSITAQTLVVQTITSSIDFVTGSTRFGSLLANTHVFSGSVTMNPGGLFVSGSGLVGIGTSSPNRALEILNTSTQLRLSYDASTYSEIRSDSSGGLLVSAANSYIINYTSGSERMRITSAGNVGIGTSAPKTNLQISNVSGADLLSFGISNYQDWVGGKIDLQGISAFGADMTFYTHPANSSNNATVVERMRITSAGNVGIGTTSPGYKLDISGSQALLKIQSTSATFGSPSINLFQGAIDTVLSATNNGLEIGTWSAHDIIFKTTQVERARISTNGLKFQNGPSYLNYYDEGTWTPIFTFDSGSPYTGATLRYIRIGKLLFLHGQTGLDTSGRSGNITVTNLPFTLETGNGQNSNDCYLAIWGLNDNCYSYGYPSYSLASTSLVLFVHGGPSLGSARYFPLAVANCNLSTIYVSFMNTFVCA